MTSWPSRRVAVHAGAEPDELTGAVSPPIYQTSTYAQDGVGQPRGGYEYARSQNPTRERLERAVAALEGGAHGIAFASGSAATAAIAELAGPGEEIVVGDDVYGGTYRYLERVHRGKGDRRALRRPRRRAGRPLGGADRAHPARLVRDAVEPAAQGRRHRGDRRDRRAAGGRGRPAAARRGRQHVRVAGAAAAADAGRRHRLPLGDEVPRRSLGHDPRRGGHLGRCRRGAAPLPPERDGRGPGTARLLPRPARPAHAAPADGASRRERRRGRRVPARTRADVADGPLPGDGRHGLVPAARRRPARADGRGAGDRDRRGHAPVHPGRVARRRGVADRAAGGDDPHVGGRLAARSRPGARPPVGRHRGRRRPHRRPARALDEA